MRARRFLRLSGFLLAFAALLNAFDGHWLALQGVAWAQMLLRNSQQYTVKTAIERTFNGKHPCHLCHEIAQARNAERTQPQSVLPDARSPELFLPRVGTVTRSGYAVRLIYACTPPEIISDALLMPPVPPPRLLS